MKGLIIASEDIEIEDKKDKTKKIKLTKISILKENNRIKEAYLSENRKGFSPNMVINVFDILEDSDYVNVEFAEDYQGKAVLDKILPFKHA